MIISFWKQFHHSYCHRPKDTMKPTEICAFLAIGIAFTHISDAYPATSIRSLCDLENPCDQEMLCYDKKCLSFDAFVSAYGPVKVNFDGGWCSSSNACTQDMLCVNNECIDKNRNWGLETSNENNVESFDIRIRPINIDETPGRNNSTVESTTAKPLLGQHGRSDGWEWN